MHCALGAVTVGTVLPICDAWGDGSMMLAKCALTADVRVTRLHGHPEAWYRASTSRGDGWQSLSVHSGGREHFGQILNHPPPRKRKGPEHMTTSTANAPLPMTQLHDSLSPTLHPEPEPDVSVDLPGLDAPPSDSEMSAVSLADSIPQRRLKLRRGGQDWEILQAKRRKAQMRLVNLRRGGGNPRQGEPRCLELFVADLCVALERQRGVDGKFPVATGSQRQSRGHFSGHVHPQCTLSSGLHRVMEGAM